MADIYDSILDRAPSQNPAPEGASIYDTLLDNRIANQNDRLMQNLASAVKVNPDLAGEAQRLSSQTNVPPEVAQRNIEEVRQRARMMQVEQMRLMKQSPILAMQLQDQSFAQIAQDQIEPLSRTEKVFKWFGEIPTDIGKGWEAGRLQVEQGYIGQRAQIGTATAEDMKRVGAIDEQLKKLKGTGGFAEATSKILGQMSETLPEAVKYGEMGALTAGGAALIAGQLGPQVALPEEVVTVPTAAIGGFFAGMTAKMAEQSYKIEAGSAYLDMIKDGIDRNVAVNVSAGVGLVNATLEVVGMGFVTAPIKNALIKEVTKEVTAALTKPTVRMAVTEFAKNYGKAWGGEVTTEILQEFSTIAGEEIARSISKPEMELKMATPEGRAELAKRIGEVFEEVGKGMAVLALPGASFNFRADIKRAAEAKRQGEFLDDLTKESADSVVRQRNPDAFENFIAAQAKDGPAENIYIDAQQLDNVLKQQGVSREQLAKVMPEAAEQLEQAVATGGDVIVPTSAYAARVAGTQIGDALKVHMRLSEDAMSVADMKQFEQNKTELMKEAKALMEQQTTTNEEFVKSAKEVEANLFAQIKESKTYTDKVARNYAEFVRDFVVTQSSALKMMPTDFYNKYMYKIEAAQQAAEAPAELFDQAGNVLPSSEAFQAFYGNSVFKDEAGNPQVLYHGTTADVSEFDLNHPGRKDTGWLGTGVYLTDNSTLAEMYADQKARKVAPAGQNVMTLYARLENPYRATMEDKARIKAGGKEAADAFTQQLKDQGYDGVILPLSEEANEIVVFNPADVKSTFNSGTWSRETANILEQRGKEQAAGKAVPTSVDEVANVDSAFKFAAGQTFATNREFKVAIQNRVLAAAKSSKVDLSDFTAGVEQYLARVALTDAVTALQTNPNAVGWYNEKVTKALRLVSLIHPEIDTDPQAKFAFTWALAVTSNGLKVDKNFELAERAYASYKETGKMPTDMQAGQAQIAINESLGLYNELIEKHGFEVVEKFMTTKTTVKEVMAFTGKNVSGENLTTEVYGAAALGPKIGNGFFANLYGHFEQLTMDRWLMRTWGRWTGTLVEENKAQVKIKKDQLKALIKAMSPEDKKAFEKIIKTKLAVGNLEEVAVAITKASTKPENRKLMAMIGKADQAAQDVFTEIVGEAKKGTQRISFGDEMRKIGNALTKYLDGQKEAPSGPPERGRIRKVMTQALNSLQQEFPSLTMSDLQALLWYPEKRLYDSAKTSDEGVTGYEDNEAPDYANAAAALAKAKGVPEDRINQTIEEVDRELSAVAAERAAGAKRNVGDSILRQGAGAAPAIDDRTGLKLNPDGTVTVYHHTNARAAERIERSGQLTAAGEPDVYVTTRAEPDTGYGDTVVPIRVDPAKLSIDDEFPNGRIDYRLNVGRPGGSIKVNVGEYQATLNQPARGGFDPKRLTTILSEKADYSTFLHETAHFFLTVYADMAAMPEATQQMKDDMQTVLDWFGVKDLATWNAMSLEEQRKYHEQFAYNYEIYLFEGKAPSVKLQGLFDRFSAWLRRVYISIRDDLNKLYREENGTDLPILTGEVREVMDRMVASEQQINQAEQVRGMMGLYQTQEQSGMDDGTWAAYQEMLKEAHDASVTEMTKASVRQLKWLSNARSKLLKEMQKTTEAQRSEVRAQVAEEVKSLPVYQATEFLKRGKIDGVDVDYAVKLSIPEIEAMYGDNPIVGLIKKSLGFGKYGMLGTESAIHPDQVADMFGFESGDALVRALLEAKPMKEEIDTRTDRRMLEEYSELSDPKAMEDAVEKALHNEARARFVAVELRYLAKATAPVRVMMSAAKQVASQIMAGKKLSEIKPREYSMAEARAAKQAEAAMKKGESLAAQQAKQNQLVQNQLAAQATEAKAEVLKALESFKKLFKADDRLAKTRNMDLVDTARSILAYYGIGGKKGKSPVEFIEKLRAYNPEMYAEIEPLIIDAATGSKQFTDLTLDQFRTLRDTIEALWFQSKRENEIMIEGKLIAKQDAVDALTARLNEIGVPIEVPGERMAPGNKERAVRMFNNTKAITRRVEHWADATDGAKGVGPFTTYIWRPIRQALDAYRIERNKYVKRYVELLKGVSLPVGKIEATELNYTFGNENGGIGKAELLGALLHTGNDSNFKKLLIGRGWGALNEDGSLDASAWRAFEKRMIDEGKLTKADYDWAQSVWDLTEEMKPMAQQAHHDIFGYYFKEVEATPVVTPFGAYRGGYVPAKTDQFLVRDAQKNAKMEELESDFRNSMPSTGMGFTKGRVEYNKPLSLDVRLLAKHIDDVIRFAFVQPAVKDVLGLIRNRDFADTLTRIDPSAVEDMLLPWLNRAARQITSEAGMHKGVDQFWRTVRARTGISIMFANLTNAMQQLTGYFLSAIKVKPTYLKESLVSYLANTQKVSEQVAELSPFMADRMQSQMFDLQENMNELLLNPSRYEKIQKWSQHHGYFLQSAFQNQVDIVTWTATYNQTLAELGADVSDERASREAVQRADAAVRLTQGSLASEDISAFEVGSPFYKTLIQFSGYFNMIANLNANEFIKIFRDLGWRGNKGKIFMQYLLGFALPMLMADAIVRTLGGQWDDEDDDGYLDEVMEWFFGSQIKGAVALVPFGTAAMVPFNAFNNKPYDDRMTTSPSVSTLEAATVGTVKAGINLANPDKQVTGKNVRDVLTMLSLVTGIPLTVLGRPIGYVVDVERGKINPTGPVDVTRGLITGKASEESTK
jgi:hypothetical protein